MSSSLSNGIWKWTFYNLCIKYSVSGYNKTPSKVANALEAFFQNSGSVPDIGMEHLCLGI